jgi:chloramphenicol-sensitive protein RarD
VSQPQHQDTTKGFLLAGGAYAMWGFLPLYLKLLAHVPAWEVVPHRILWSLPIAALVVWWSGLFGKVWTAITTPRMLAMAFLTSAIISLNWGVYVWSISANRVLESALGYYINPLFSIFLAATLIGEKLKPLQWASIALACVAVGVLTWDAGGLPWISLALAFSWGFYAYFKRSLPIGATEGFLLEIMILTIPALAMVFYYAGQGQSHFMGASPSDTLLLAASGLFTAIPLMLYANGAKHLRLTTIAMMQYSAPTMIFLIAVFVFKEPFSSAKLLAFLLIWTALALYTWSLVYNRKT